MASELRGCLEETAVSDKTESEIDFGLRPRLGRGES